MSLRTIRIALWVAVAGFAVLATLAYFFVKVPAPGQGGIGGGNYALTTGSGAAFTPASLQGKPSMLFFGFTHCPQVCPTTLSEMAVWYEELGAEGEKLNAFFVSVDPERDTPAVVEDYVRAVSDKVTAVTGSPDQVAAMTKAWGAFAEKVPLEDGDYTMDHTASVYLIDGQGQFQGTIAYGEGSGPALEKLRRLIAKG